MRWAGLGWRLALVAMVTVWLRGVAMGEAAPGAQAAAQAAPQPAVGAPQAAAPGAAAKIPPAPAPGPGAPPAPREDLMGDLFGENLESEPGLRLAGTPNMFGDSFLNNGGASVWIFLPPDPPSFPQATTLVEASLPLAGGSRRVKIGEDNLPLTQDRIHFMYNHFQNALQVDASGAVPGLPLQSFSVDRYTIGWEKTFLDRLWSVELRMPLANGMDFATTDFGLSSGSVGNLAILLKRMVYQSDNMAVAAGLGIDTPTGSEVRGYLTPTSFVMRNQAVHLMPYIGLLEVPSERLFYQCFLQVDVPTNGNRVDYSDPVAGAGTFGVLSEATLLYADVSIGYWLFRDRPGRVLRGLAWLGELHYTTSLERPAAISGTPSTIGFEFQSAANPIDLLNLTVGLHAEIARCTTCRVAGVFPLRSGDDRAFDSEIQVQLQRRF